MPTPSPSSSPRRRRRLVAALLVAASAIAAPLTTGAPAGAAAAPLVTTEGIGIRINESAITGAVLDQIEAEITPAVASHLDDGALAHSGMATPDWTLASFDLDLGVDFINWGTPGYPEGGLALTATVDDLLMQMYRLGQWWQPECLINVDDTGPLTMTAKVRVDSSVLPNPPFSPMPSTEDWSAAWPNEAPAPGYSWLCNSYTTGFDWTGFSDPTNPASPAALVLDLVETALADLADDLWNDNVWPVMESLTTYASFDFSIFQVRTDGAGLVAIGRVDATNGVTVAGSGPYPVSNAVDSGITASINIAMTKTSQGGVPSDVIVSLHPNVTNQYLAALHQELNGDYGTTAIDSSIATALVDPILGTCYDPNDWTTRLEAQAPAHVTNPTGIPEMQLPLTTVQFRNAGCNPDPRVATFTGSLDDIAVSATGIPLSPNGSPTTATWTATRTQADAATAARSVPATPGTLLPWAHGALGTFLGSYVPGHVDMTPGGLAGQLVTHTLSGGYSGDRHITETFDVA